MHESDRHDFQTSDSRLKEDNSSLLFSTSGDFAPSAFSSLKPGILQVSVPEPFLGGGTDYDVCIIRAKRCRERGSQVRPFSLNESSPLLTGQSKEG